MRKMILILPIILMITGCASKEPKKSEVSISNGAINREDIDTRIRDKKLEFRSCYEALLNSKSSNNSGKVILAWVIQKNGKVSEATVYESEISDLSFQTCLVNILKSITFIKPSDNVTIKYPLNFHSKR